MTTTTSTPAVTLTLAGLPESPPCCPVEGPVTGWLLAVHGGLLQVMCPRCFTAVAPVRAVAAKAGSSDEIRALREQIETLSEALDLHGTISH